MGKISGFEGCPWQRRTVAICLQFLSITCITAEINNDQAISVNIDVTAFLPEMPAGSYKGVVWLTRYSLRSLFEPKTENLVVLLRELY